MHPHVIKQRTESLRIEKSIYEGGKIIISSCGQIITDSTSAADLLHSPINCHFVQLGAGDHQNSQFSRLEIW